MNKRLAVTLTALGLTAATMAAVIVFDSPNAAETLRGKVTHHQISSPRANEAFRTVWAELENKAAASFTVKVSENVKTGQCVEFVRLERRFTRISHYRFTRYC